MRISIVIPNFNGARLLKKNLPKILDAVGDAEVIVVDDASTDDSVVEIKNQISNIKNTRSTISGQAYKKLKLNIKLLENKRNLGFAPTVNRGVKEASGDLVVLLNTDIIPENKFLNSAIFHFQDPDVFAVGFLQKCPKNGKVILRGRGIGKFEKGFLAHARGAVSDKDTSDGVQTHSSELEDFSKTLWVSAGAGIFRKSIWERLGGLDILYSPFYWEDIDLSYRALKSGYRLVFEADSVVLHDQSKSAIRSSYSKEFVNTIAYRNQILFVWLNITDLSFMLNHLLYLPIHLAKAFISGNVAYLVGFILAFLKIPRVLARRNKNRKLFTISDKEVLANHHS